MMELVLRLARLSHTEGELRGNEGPEPQEKYMLCWVAEAVFNYTRALQQAEDTLLSDVEALPGLSKDVTAREIVEVAHECARRFVKSPVREAPVRPPKKKKTTHRRAKK